MNTAVETLAVRDIATTDLITLSPDMQLREAIELLDRHHITGAPVVSGRLIVGVLSMMDILTFEATTPPVPNEREAAEQETARLDSATEENRGDGARRIEPGRPDDWNEDAEPSAYFTDFWDDAGADVVDRIRSVEGPEWDFLADHTVSEAMTLGVRGVQADTPLPDTAAYMLDNAIHRVLVLDGRELLGVVSTTDFLRAVAGRLG